MDLAECMNKFLTEPDDIHEIQIEEPSQIAGYSVEERIQDPNVRDLDSIVRAATFWGNSYISMKMDMDPSLPDAVTIEDSRYVFPFPVVLETIKHMMRVGQRKHFNASVDKTITNWFRKLFISLNKLFGIDAILGLDRATSIDGGFSVREFCFRCFVTIRNISKGDVTPDGVSVPIDPDMLIWYMAPVKAWMMTIILEDVVQLKVLY